MGKQSNNRYKKMVEDRFDHYGLTSQDTINIEEIFKSFVALVERKRGNAINDHQIKGILDTVDFSVRNVLNFIKSSGGGMK